MKLNLFVISDDFAKGDDDLFLRYLAYTWRHSPLAFEYSGVNRSDWSVVEIQRRIAENDCFVVAVVDSSLGEKTSTAVDAAKQHKRGYIVAAPLVLALDRRRRRHAGLSEGSCVVTFDDAMAAIVEWLRGLDDDVAALAVAAETYKRGRRQPPRSLQPAPSRRPTATSPRPG